MQDFRFQFMNKIKVAEKPLSITYIHNKGDNRTILEGTLAFDPCNRLSANYMVGTENCKLKYSYVHGGVTTFEPSFNLPKNSWDLAVSQKICGNDVLKATYQTSSRVLGLEWSLNSMLSGHAKVTFHSSFSVFLFYSSSIEAENGYFIGFWIWCYDPLISCKKNPCISWKLYFQLTLQCGKLVACQKLEKIKSLENVLSMHHECPIWVKLEFCRWW